MYQHVSKKQGARESDCTISMAFVSFKSMRGQQACYHCLSKAPRRSREVSEELGELFYGRYLGVSKVCKAENLIWEHLHYSRCNRCVRSSLVNLLAVLMIYLAFLCMIELKTWQDRVQAGAGSTTTCPNDPVPAAVAVADWDKPPG